MEVEISKKQLDDLKMAWRIFGPSPLELFFNHQVKQHQTIFAENEDAFLQNTIAFNAEGYTCYFGLQERRPGLNQPGTNSDIAVLKWLYIDLDPEKPSKEICSSDEEKARAIEAARTIIRDCVAGENQGPLFMDSGNGYWLFFRIPDIPITDSNRAEIAARLKAWGDKITGFYRNQFPGVVIDAGIYDLRRITKIPGTRIYNKNEADNRPRRLSAFISTHNPIPDQKLYDSFMALEIPVQVLEKPQEEFNHTSPGKLHPERITDGCYTINFIKDKGVSGVSLPHNIRLALSTLSNGLDDLGNDLQFIRPILSGCPDYDETKTRYYLSQNVGKSAPYSCGKFKELAIEHFVDFDPALCNCRLPPHGKAKPSPIRYAYPSIADMAAAFNSVQWDRGDSFQRFLQQKEFAGDWFKFFDSKETEEFLRAHKADQGLRVDTIKALVKDSADSTDDRSISDILIAIASEQATYFKDSDGNLYAEMSVERHIETHPIKGKSFETWLRREFYKRFQKGCAPQPTMDAILTIEAKYLWDCKTYPVFVRIGGDEKSIFIDLCNDSYQVVQISESGYQVIDKSPVKFRRSSGMMPLPYPVAGQSLSLLREYLNLKNPEDWKLIAAFVIACARPTGPYPVLCLTGEQGSAKSTACRLIREIIDPSSTPLRQIPRENRDLMISAVNSWVLAFDNMSQIPPWLSDLLCRLATGGGMAIRTMYADMDETLFQATRPIILNGINSVTSEPDLADRSIPISLATISEVDRKTEAEVIERFDKVKPGIFGSLCQAVSVALKNITGTKLERLPRMADFALWATAAEPAYCLPGEFMAAYSGNRQAAIDESLASSSVMDAIFIMTGEPGFVEWEGTPTDLLQILNEKAGDKIQRSKSWPKEQSHLIRKLNKAEPQLRSRGITIEHTRKSNKRKVKLIKACESAVIAVMVGEKPMQHTENSNNSAMTAINNFPSCSVKLPSCDQVAVMVPAGDRDGNDGNTIHHDGNNITGAAFPSWQDTVKNQDVKVNHDGNDGNDGIFTSFGINESAPINPTDPQKPKVRYVI